MPELGIDAFQGPFLGARSPSVYSYVTSGLVVGFLCTEFTSLSLSPSDPPLGDSSQDNQAQSFTRIT